MALTVALASIASGCADETETLFDEAGASWSLIEYDLEGVELRDVREDLRGNAYLLKFRPDLGVVQTAACVNEENPVENPGQGDCLLAPEASRWVCHCLSYKFVEDRMAWKSFEPGGMPLPVDFPPDPPPDPPLEGDPATDPRIGAHTIDILPEAERKSTYRFSALPFGVFGSDGSTSIFVFQKKAASLFDRVFTDPDGRAGCTPCVENF